MATGHGASRAGMHIGLVGIETRGGDGGAGMKIEGNEERDG